MDMIASSPRSHLVPSRGIDQPQRLPCDCSSISLSALKTVERKIADILHALKLFRAVVADSFLKLHFRNVLLNHERGRFRMKEVGRESRFSRCGLPLADFAISARVPPSEH